MHAEDVDDWDELVDAPEGFEGAGMNKAEITVMKLFRVDLASNVFDDVAVTLADKLRPCTTLAGEPALTELNVIYVRSLPADTRGYVRSEQH